MAYRDQYSDELIATGNFLFLALIFRLSKCVYGSHYWRRPGRQDEERAKFARLMIELERVRIRQGLSKAELALTEAVSRSCDRSRYLGLDASVCSQVCGPQKSMRILYSTRCSMARDA